MKPDVNTLDSWRGLLDGLVIDSTAEVQIERAYQAGKRAWVMDIVAGDVGDQALILQAWDTRQRRERGQERVPLTAGELLNRLEGTNDPSGPQMHWRLVTQAPFNEAPLFLIDEARIEGNVLVLRCAADCCSE